MLQDNEILKIDEAAANNTCENGSLASSQTGHTAQHFFISTLPAGQIKLTSAPLQTSNPAILPSDHTAGNHRLVEQGVGGAADHHLYSTNLLGLPPRNKRRNSIVNSETSSPVNSTSVISNKPPAKRLKLDQTQQEQRDSLIEIFRNDIRDLKVNYQDHLTELFFLQSGGNLLDYVSFKKNPIPQLIAFLKNNVLDEGDEILPCERTSPIKSELPATDNSELAPDAPKAAAADPVRPPSAPNKHGATSPNKSANKPQSISAVYDSTIGSQEEIVERAKQEAYVMQRISELRKEGLWSLKRLPKVQEQPRSKTHWDYLLEEMAWLATDFAQEKKWKKNAAKKCAKMIMKYHQDKELKAEREEKEEHQKLRRIASTMAKEVKLFWSNIEKLAEFKQQTWLEEKRKKALDLHLNFIVDQTEKFSSWLTEGMAHKEDATRSSFGDNDKDAAAATALTKRTYSEANSEDDSNLSKKLRLATPDSSDDEQSNVTKELSGDFNTEGPDDEFQVDPGEDEADDETTLMEQEKHEKDTNYSQELNELQALGEMPLEDLWEMYAQKPESDEDSFSSAGQDDEDDSESDLSDTSEAEPPVEEPTDNRVDPSKDITDIAATAESFQPKGNTLSTTQVKTAVPFLLKHTLREYQHIGLDWLVAMQCKKLNGILADEMGLGKTIQTIALLGHLACDRGVWGPHLIVVPTSVMLNWEMEIKKWCPAFKIITYFGNPKERKLKRQGWTKFNAFHICITSYKMVIQDHQSFRRMRWVYFILDEAQHIKNFKSQRWQMLLNFQSSHRLLLTGTPLQNNLMELWSLMHFLMPNVFQSHREFRDWFANPVTGMIDGSQDYNEGLIKRLHKVLRPFLLRRLKSEVEKQLPKKYEHVVVCRLSKRQRFLYDDFMSQTKTKETLASGSFMSVINVLMQLRKVCNHPNMFESRPIISPFTMDGLTLNLPSLVWDALVYHPLKHVSLWSLNLLLADLELSLTALAAHAQEKCQTPTSIILDPRPPSEQPPCPAGRIRLHVRGAAPPSSGPSLPLTSPITVQIHQAGAKVSVPIGIGRVVQTTSGQHILLTPLPPAETLPVSLAATIPPEMQQRTLVVEPSSPHPTLASGGLTLVSGAETSKRPHGSDLIVEHMRQRHQEIQRARLEMLARVNKFHCTAIPTYGTDLIQTLTIQKAASVSPAFGAFGQLTCRTVGLAGSRKLQEHLTTTDCLGQLIQHTTQARLSSLLPIVSRYVFVVPPVKAPPVELNTHLQPSNTRQYLERRLLHKLSEDAAFLHPIISNTRTQFPDMRLIQYDCGKLQTLDRLLWSLKQDTHRVLIFTQMTRMLDILEQFLNYHGHTYLRLDGATRVEQRQVMMERFNADKRIFCFILSTRSGGIGVNLTGADTVIFYDSDWNPTMDAQAQDRCHRIGQTRDVHIYRLVSQKTVEENILKKANQKRMLGNLAIEGGNFTTAFFKKETIRDLFDLDLGEDSVDSAAPAAEELPAEKFSQQQLEQALGMAEEDQDIQAATTARAEAAAELAEFDETIPLEGDQTKEEDKTQVEEELDKLVEQLTPVEKYALRFLELIHEPFSQEQLKQAEEEIEAQKKDWELGRLKAMKEEEERMRANMVEGADDPMLTLAREDITQEYVYQDEIMPIWAPPTPPKEEEEDLYFDQSLAFFYETTPMSESLLPPLYVKKESKKIKSIPAANRKQKVRGIAGGTTATTGTTKEDTMQIPRSLFDRPSAAILKLRREVKLQRVKSLVYSKPVVGAATPGALKSGPLVVNKPTLDTEQDTPEWLIHEDWTILQVVQDIQQLALNLVVVSPAQIPNWDLVSDALGGTRSSRQCRARYDAVILPREEGRILYDTNPKKQKKSKGLYKTKNTRPMRTSQLFAQDNNSSFTQLFQSRFESIASFSGKRTITLRKWTGNSKSAASVKTCVLAENGIDYNQPLSPVQVAQNRAERIARDKQNKHSAAAALAPNAAAAVVAVTAAAPIEPVKAQTPQLTTTSTHQPAPPNIQAVIATFQNIQGSKTIKPISPGMVVTPTSTVPVTIVGPEGMTVTTNAAQLTSQRIAVTSAPRGTQAVVSAAVTGQQPARALATSSLAYRQTTILRQQQQQQQRFQIKKFHQQQQQQQAAAQTVAVSSKLAGAPRVTLSEAEMAQLLKRQQLKATSQPVAIPVSTMSGLRQFQLHHQLVHRPGKAKGATLGSVQIMQPATSSKAVPVQQLIKQVLPLQMPSGARMIPVQPGTSAATAAATLKPIQVVAAPTATVTELPDANAILDDGKKSPHTLRLRKP